MLPFRGIFLQRDLIDAGDRHLFMASVADNLGVFGAISSRLIRHFFVQLMHHLLLVEILFFAGGLPWIYILGPLAACVVVVIGILEIRIARLLLLRVLGDVAQVVRR